MSRSEDGLRKYTEAKVCQAVHWCIRGQEKQKPRRSRLRGTSKLDRPVAAQECAALAWRAILDGGISQVGGTAWCRGQVRLPRSPTYVAPCLRVSVGKQGHRYAFLAGIFGSQEHTTYCQIYRIGADAVQGFLARLGGARQPRNRSEPACPLCQNCGNITLLGRSLLSWR